MLGLELIVILGVTVLTCSVAARRLKVAAPVMLLVVGTLIGFIPLLREVSLPSEVMLLVFLPALLYWESLTTSLREIRRFMRVIILSSTVLVVATAAGVAAVAHALGMAWGPAWILGAALAPTDATVVGVLARGLPRRTMTTLRAESLINDGTALVIFGIAVSVTAGSETFSLGNVSWLFVLAYGGGAIAGIIAAWLAVQVRKRLDNPLYESTVSILTPFVAFLLAEVVHASGVLAVVVCGLILSQIGPRLVHADTRRMSEAFWGLSTFLLNGALFVLVGLQANTAVRGLSSTGVLSGLGLVGLISVAVIGVRFLWLFTTPYIIRAIDRRPRQRELRAGPRARIVSGVSGFRGAVSMAAALAVPELAGDGTPFPGRDLIIFVTAGVIAVTLVVQSLALPPVLRWAQLPPDTQLDEERAMAVRTASEAAFEAMPKIAAELGTDPLIIERTRREYEKHMQLLRESDGDEDVDEHPYRRLEADYQALRLAMLSHKRSTIVRLRDEQLIDDTVLRHIQAKLDIEEVRLSRREVVE
ncbi:CPA1 family monovalent cation:H+ antiporter [Kibdelosporangium banguiense]|uniref:CPA1 family monovalent cation:H+ antiporter n=1 Tax=Kibdelosporangium banguiense TaxID=1365924 RepID=A0ABS4TMM1_9PSEU|nr:Na+/H+ antiporter [Kibdelosporangium banguiense]MBP2325604.1 CPA1 family monovalent cation:H+ antiporter [Kibdelosporangium banguiense]